MSSNKNCEKGCRVRRTKCQNKHLMEIFRFFCVSGESLRNIMRNKSVWNIVKPAIITKIIHHANRRNWEFGIPSFINYEYRLPVKNGIKAPVATWEYMKARKLRTKQENRDYIFIRPKNRELGMPNNLTNFAFGKNAVGGVSSSR